MLPRQHEWRDVPPLDDLHSWLGIPLVAAGHVLGILVARCKAAVSVYDRTSPPCEIAWLFPQPSQFKTPEFMSAQKSTAAELEARLQELRETQKALEHVEKKPLRFDQD